MTGAVTIYFCFINGSQRSFCLRLAAPMRAGDKNQKPFSEKVKIIFMAHQLRHCKLNIEHCNGQNALTNDIGLGEKISAHTRSPKLSGLAAQKLCEGGREGTKTRVSAIFCTKSTFQPVNYPVPSQAFQNNLLYGETYER
jgi:hypothetical protein